MKVLIIGGGTAPSVELLKKEIQNCDYIICADKGGEYIRAIDKLPDMLLGDFDSLKEKLLEYYLNSGVRVERFPAKKDYTDTELCLQRALQLNPNEVVFLACTGSRLDHVFGNIGLLKELLDKDIQGYIKDDNNTIFLVKGDAEISGYPGKLVSFQAFSEIVKGLTIEGVSYPLNKFNLSSWSAYTVSNIFLSDKVKISFDSGILMIIFPKD
ncbi:thiamine diphosphokinase [Alloiococcus sp. CFN-8]|uniref:thiamine diphosphokinase n=1 Tax=Alloiococcus sp. CFN-8 TaxID=3416081 RepID=UPI003CF1AD61